MTALVQELAPRIESMTDKPFAFYGQCFGALVAFEVSRELRRRESAMPTKLFVAAQPAPRARGTGKPVHALPRDKLVDYLRTIGGTDEQVLEDRELLELLEPAIRADLEIADTYEYVEEAPLNVPIVAVGGTADELVTGPSLARWSEETNSTFQLEVLPIGHMPTSEDWVKIGEAIEKAVARDET
jgi:myxalamid-type polyketide synthase MxaE and MxaD